MPLLANDMHLLMSAPAVWYENHLVCEAVLDVTGVTFPGIPYVVAGHNGRVAWGFTNGFADVQDLYIERMRVTANGDIEYEYCGVAPGGGAAGGHPGQGERARGTAGHLHPSRARHQ